MARFAFHFAPAYRAAALPFGVTPGRAWAEIDGGPGGGLRVRFGSWRLHTPLANITGHERSRDFAFLKTAGPPHLSFADRGISFATHAARNRDAVCVSFAEPVPGIDPTRILKHPGATLTLADVDAFVAELDRLRAAQG